MAGDARPRPGDIAGWQREARERTVRLVDDLDDARLRVPLLPIVNPLLWEIGHVAWFQEQFVLRHGAGLTPLRSDGDALYDSSAVAHDTRWDLRLPDRRETYGYMRAVLERAVSRLEAGTALPVEELDLHLLALFHEDMHGEAFLYMRQTLGYPAPRLGLHDGEPAAEAAGDLPGDVDVPGGRFLLGATPQDGFVFDNEQWAHAVELAPFSIARAPVTQREFVRFVDQGGYRDRSLWSDEGWAWREAARAEHPVYYRRDGGGGWLRRHFDRWVPLEPHRPVIHVNFHEAEAWCSWAGRRLPTEAEWEAAAAGTPKRRFPWGAELPGARQANLDASLMDTVDVAAHPAGDSPFGCRQMIGNVWEWTASVFEPYPGFEPGLYREYSEPWFGTRRVLRGGAWATRGRMLRNTWRNYFTPERRDVFAGFRTCAPRR